MDIADQSHTPDGMSQLVNSRLDDIERVVYAGFAPRFFAYLIDLIVIWSLNSIVSRPLLNVTGLADAKLWIELLSAANICQSAVFFLYFILMTLFFSATLGKMILGLSVHSLDDNPLSKGQILFREFIGRYISMAVLGIPYLVVIFTKRHQGIHDMFADTSVIKNKMIKLHQELKSTTN
ncbi:RDD family protein [Thalassobacillus sp. CUG 92003]|uniref:RDD family protein n=1 Tax=Thalassobacillus sp. CUG 92003 TaxID=2736641 RepID=UPI0015E78D99|nr:RDD family protein [Thalassobacillus sp. CUG 92003]